MTTGLRRRGVVAAIASAAGGAASARAGTASLGAPSASARTGWITDARFDLPAFGPKHPEQPRRVQAIQAALEQRPALQSKLARLAVAGDAAIDAAIMRVHTKAHVEGIRTRYDAEINLLARAAVGASVAAVDAVHERRIVNAFVASRPPGHHASNTGREEGFCFFSNVAIAARHAQALGHARVLIVDWDYHHGNGTEALFYDDASVFYFSTFDPAAYPRTGDPARTGRGAGRGSTANHPLRCGATDADVLAIYRDHLVPIADRFRPDFVLVSAGFDSREDDLLGCFRLTDDGYRRMTGVVAAIAARHAGGHLVSVLEGGYNVAGLASAAMAHTQALVDAAQDVRR
jgi:acetoin utilization deacetylase AcuC-like enzyme